MEETTEFVVTISNTVRLGNSLIYRTTPEPRGNSTTNMSPDHTINVENSEFVTFQRARS